MPVLGVLGGGQLGRMLALEGAPLGIDFRFYDPSSAESVTGIGVHDRAAWDDVGALDRFAASVDAVTWEFENVPVTTAERLRAAVPVHPSPGALAVAQDRLAEKEAFTRLEIPTNAFHPVSSAAELAEGIERIGLPAVLKTRRFGYDGKGQAVLRGEVDVEAVWAEMGGVPCLLEAFVPFQREVSLVGVRGRDGETRFWPLVENVHVEGILRRTTAPAPEVDRSISEAAHGYLERLFDELDYVGVLAVEFFRTEDGLLANEMAPRVHNSGHWTQDGAETSQFENHVRAVMGLPLGRTSARGVTVMVNLIGDHPPVSELLEERARVHLYGKSPRPGRKLGHVNLVGASLEEVAERADRLEAAAPIR